MLSRQVSVLFLEVCWTAR